MVESNCKLFPKAYLFTQSYPKENKKTKKSNTKSILKKMCFFCLFLERRKKGMVAMWCSLIIDIGNLIHFAFKTESNKVLF